MEGVQELGPGANFPSCSGLQPAKGPETQAGGDGDWMQKRLAGESTVFARPLLSSLGEGEGKDGSSASSLGPA